MRIFEPNMSRPRPRPRPTTVSPLSTMLAVGIVCAVAGAAVFTFQCFVLATQGTWPDGSLLTVFEHLAGGQIQATLATVYPGLQLVLEMMLQRIELFSALFAFAAACILSSD